MEVTLQYFDGCPNWETTSLHLMALASEGSDITLSHELIDGYRSAAERGFRGSPTVLIEGIDPFFNDNAPIGLTCRIYATDAGPAGSPTREQLREAMAGRAERMRAIPADGA